MLQIAVAVQTLRNAKKEREEQKQHAEALAEAMRQSPPEVEDGVDPNTVLSVQFIPNGALDFNPKDPKPITWWCIKRELQFTAARELLYTYAFASVFLWWMVPLFGQSAPIIGGGGIAVAHWILSLVHMIFALVGAIGIIHYKYTHLKVFVYWMTLFTATLMVLQIAALVQLNGICADLVRSSECASTVNTNVILFTLFVIVGVQVPVIHLSVALYNWMITHRGDNLGCNGCTLKAVNMIQQTPSGAQTVHLRMHEAWLYQRGFYQKDDGETVPILREEIVAGIAGGLDIPGIQLQRHAAGGGLGAAVRSKVPTMPSVPAVAGKAQHGASASSAPQQDVQPLANQAAPSAHVSAQQPVMPHGAGSPHGGVGGGHGATPNEQKQQQQQQKLFMVPDGMGGQKVVSVAPYGGTPASGAAGNTAASAGTVSAAPAAAGMVSSPRRGGPPPPMPPPRSA